MNREMWGTLQDGKVKETDSFLEATERNVALPRA